jgi:hypothetical protein
MKHLSLVIAASIVAALALAPGTALAKTVELGQTTTPLVAPSCPKGVPSTKCLIVLERTTAVQSASDGVSYPTTVKKDGWITSFTVGLSNLSSNPATERRLIHGLDHSYQGTPQIAISVLKPGPNNTYTVVAQSATFHVLPFLGQVLEEPFSLPPTFTTFTALPVKAGEVIGLTVPTWAPVLTYNLTPSKFSYRQSRMARCKYAAAGQTAQVTVGASTRYLCQYSGTRVEYSVTEVLNAPYPKTYVH